MTSLDTAGAEMCHWKTHDLPRIWKPIIGSSKSMGAIGGLGQHCSMVHSKSEEAQSSTWPENVGGRSSLFHFAAAFVQKTGQFALATLIGVAVYRGFQLWHAILVLVFISVVQCYEELWACLMTVALCLVDPGSHVFREFWEFSRWNMQCLHRQSFLQLASVQAGLQRYSVE